MTTAARVPLLAIVLLFAACAATPVEEPPAPRPEPPPAAGAEVPVEPVLPPTPGLVVDEEELLARVRLNPRSPRAWSALGMAAYEDGRYDVAEERFGRVVTLSPGDRDAWLNRGLARFAMKDYGAALGDFRRVLSMPSDPDLFTDYRLALIDYEERVARGEVSVPFPEAVRRDLLPVDRAGMFARWYGRIAAILERGPGFAREHRARSAHYRVLTDDSQGLAELAAGALELALTEYERLFPPPPGRAPSGKFAVTIFSSRAAYVGYLTELLDDRATAHLSGGSYHPLFRELIMTKAADLDETLLVLLHEGFHQYLHSFLPSAPTWFGEGLADYFGASRLVSGGLVPGEPHPLRTDDLAKALEVATPETLVSILTAKPEEFMGGRIANFRQRAARVGRNYALSWAFAHFLVEGEDRPLLLQYYDAVRRGADARLAYQAAFRDVDMEALYRRFERHARDLVSSDPP